MFAIGDKMWPGVSKLVEEIGELGQVLGKLMGSRGKLEHWSGDLWGMLHDEIGDMLGAVKFVMERCTLDVKRIHERAEAKYNLFQEWHKKDPES